MKSPLEITTTSGPVLGLRREDGAVFFDIPYAAAPTGAHRFAPPRPHAPWTDVRYSGMPGPTAPQPRRETFGVLDMTPYFGPGWIHGADYLTLTIWTPAVRDRRAPVMVFVHGGGFLGGSTRSALYDGQAFARDGVVLITVNYRLGIPGFLHLDDAPDNRGLLDVLAALRWIQSNAAAFGGDPANVTLFGQSAGAILAGGVVTDPASRGLLHRAILQSGTGTGALTAEQAELVTEAAGLELGLTPTAATLAEVPDGRFVEITPRLATVDLRVRDTFHPLGGLTPFSLVLDRQPAAYLAAGHGVDVDLLIGSNTEEGNLYLAPQGGLADVGETDLLAAAARSQRNPAELVEAYRLRRPDAAGPELLSAIVSDALFGNGTRRMAAAHATASAARTFLYEFTWRSSALDGTLGAAHTMELPFVFDRVGLPELHGQRALLGTDEPPADLARRMRQAWVRFATTGDPGWARHTVDHRATMHIGGRWQLRDAAGDRLDAVKFPAALRKP
ncbi:carboxylesterase family protein [Amycolatopsis sp. EV170708-02-1]|uniref:carboxylesterase/lipase family protein n=1 Tax=Amycolatopsis sp. EV170708-02-1 TaxID=2919322 RepID=UPI0028F40A9D|nr:carboxylesterase family protein [Amycolatopsis sp. EV170708-02-1]